MSLNPNTINESINLKILYMYFCQTFECTELYVFLSSVLISSFYLSVHCTSGFLTIHNLKYLEFKIEKHETVSQKEGVIYIITKTCLYNFDPLKPHFYILKLEFAGVNIIFLISAQRHKLYRLSEAVLTSTHNLCFEQKYEKYQFFI